MFIRRCVSDSEIILITIVSSTSFYSNHLYAIRFIKQYGFIHNIGRLLYELFEIVSDYFKDFCCELHYIIDSFPVAVFNNMRAANCRILKDNKWRETQPFYGVKAQLLTTKDGIPMPFILHQIKTAYAKALDKMIDKLPAES